MREERGSEVTVVGLGARLEGTVTLAGSLRVDGRIHGQIKADGDVTLSQESQVEGDISGRNVTVAGALTGNVVAENRAELAPSARVQGDITSKTLVIVEGAHFQGRSIMGGSGAPAEGDPS